MHVWLLILIASFAWSPAQYVFRHLEASPSRRDITKPQGDLSWRTQGNLTRSLTILLALGAAAIFIFTPQAEQLAKAPRFYPFLMASFAAFALFTVGRSFLTGIITPFIRGNTREYDRKTEPKRYWASFAWNLALGCGAAWAAFAVNEDAARTLAEDHCFSQDSSSTFRGVRDACQKTVAFYDKDLGRDPQAFHAHYNRALAHQNIGELGPALTGYSTAIRLRPNDPDAYINRGLIYLDNYDYDLAIVDFTRARRLQPKDAWPIANRGLAYAWKGDEVSATRDFTEAKSIDPTNIVVMRGEALLAMNAADFGLAVTRLNRALGQEPDDPWSLALRANAYGRLGELEKARADSARVRDLNVERGS